MNVKLQSKETLETTVQYTIYNTIRLYKFIDSVLTFMVTLPATEHLLFSNHLKKNLQRN